MSKDLHNTIRQIIKEIRFSSSKGNYLKAVRLRDVLIVPYKDPYRDGILYIEGERDKDNGIVIFYPGINDWDFISDDLKDDLDKRNIPYEFSTAIGKESLTVDYSYFETELATLDTLDWIIETKEWYNTF